MPDAGVSWTAVLRSRQILYVRQLSTVPRRRVSICPPLQRLTERLSGTAYCRCIERPICACALLYILSTANCFKNIFTLCNSSDVYVSTALIKLIMKLECGPMPNLMVALPNIGGALCSIPQSLADADY